MILRFIGYSAEEIEEMDFSAVHRVLVLKEMITGFINQLLGSFTQETPSSVSTEGGTHHQFKNTPDNYKIENPYA